MRRTGGFTLIELVIVLVIVALLAAVAAPRFLDLRDEAEQAVLSAQADSLRAAATLNYAKWIASGRAVTSEVDGVERLNSCGGQNDPLFNLVDSFDQQRFELSSGGDGARVLEVITVPRENRLTCSLDLRAD